MSDHAGEVHRTHPYTLLQKVWFSNITLQIKVLQEYSHTLFWLKFLSLQHSRFKHSWNQIQQIILVFFRLFLIKNALLPYIYLSLLVVVRLKSLKKSKFMTLFKSKIDNNDQSLHKRVLLVQTLIRFFLNISSVYYTSLKIIHSFVKVIWDFLSALSKKIIEQKMTKFWTNLAFLNIHFTSLYTGRDSYPNIIALYTY